MKTNTSSINKKVQRQTSATAPHHSSQPDQQERARQEAVDLANDACRYDPELDYPTKPTPPTTTATSRARTDTRLPIDHERRDANRKLSTDAVLRLLQAALPAAHRTAEVIGKWIWVSFDTPPAPETRQQLAQLGFHWNNTRQTWQHPCGQFSMHGAGDPRDRYGSQPVSELTTTGA